MLVQRNTTSVNEIESAQTKREPIFGENLSASNLHGTYEGWKDIAKEAVKYKLPAFAMILPLAKTVAQILETPALLVNFYGYSSIGKTLLLQLATSAYANAGDPNVGDSFIQKLTSSELLDNTTGMLVLDELHMASDKEFSNAVTKIQANSLILSAGEQSIVDKLSKTSPSNFIAIRVLDIHLKGQILTDFEGNELASLEAEKLATKLKEQCALYYGHAGCDFERQLSNLADSKVIIQQDAQVMLERLTDDIELVPALRRAMGMLAMIAVAGHYAVRFGILPMTEQRVFDTVVHVRNLWLSEITHNGIEKNNKEDSQTLHSFLMPNYLNASILPALYLCGDSSKGKTTLLQLVGK
jgi:translation initiation factor 1 (eIF-1/SUI1)